jgi:HPt (histidine-containing phosphotransfer) domain-containing protein
MTDIPVENADELIDWSVALQNAGGDESLLVEVFGLFLEEAQERLSHIHQALRDQDYVLLNRSAHTLKSLLRTVGAASAMASAEQLEFHFRELAEDRRKVEKGAPDAEAIAPSRIATAFAEAPRMVEEFEPRLERVITAVRERLGK